MKFRIFEDAKSFKSHVVPTLLRDEASNNIMLDMLFSPQCTNDSIALLLSCVEDRDRILAAATMSPPKNLVLYVDIETQSAIEELATGLLELDYSIPGVIGQRDATTHFAQLWAKRKKQKLTIEMEQILYRVDSVKRINSEKGRLQVVSSEKIDTLLAWMKGFYQEIHVAIPSDQIRNRADDRIAKQNAYFWVVKDVPMSMAIHSRSTQNGASISGVYTPPEQRRQ